MRKQDDIQDPLIVSPLFTKQDFDGQIQLLARDKDKTSLINIVEIDYYFYIGKIPTWTESDFIDFLQMNLPNDVSITIEKKVDGEQFAFGEPWSFFKLSSKNYKTIHSLLSEKSTKTGIQYRQNNYYLQNFTGDILNDTYSASKLHFEYNRHYSKLIFEKLRGLDRLMYQQLQYPFRFVDQSPQSIQTKYNLNFQQTLVFSRYKLREIKNSHFKYDQIITVNINDIRQNPVNIPCLQYYKTCMFDIENKVVRQNEETFVGWENVRTNQKYPVLKQMYTALSKRKGPQKIVDKQTNGYVGLLGLKSKDADQEDTIKIDDDRGETQRYNSSCCDQNEIICVSFIVSDFNGKCLKRIALVRSEYKPSEEYADEVIQVVTEYQLLEQMILILGNKDYNIIMHFNGWDFDEKMVATRMLLHGLIEKYLAAMNIENEFSKSDFTHDGKMKTSNGFNLFQITNPLRFSFDVLMLNKIMNSDSDKLDSQGLNSLLNYYDLGSKEGITYQQLTDFFTEYQAAQKELAASQQDITRMIRENDPRIQRLKAAQTDMQACYNYCQFDSIQQTRLQNHLGLLSQMIQMSSLTKVPLKLCVFNAISTKIDSIITDTYFKHDLMHIDDMNPFNRIFNPKRSVAKKYMLEKKEKIQVCTLESDQEENVDGEGAVDDVVDDEDGDEYEEDADDKKKATKDDDKHFIVNYGGLVILFRQGFAKSSTAVDIISMYPAQKEANNIDKCCLMTAENLEHALLNQSDFFIVGIRVVQSVDMYSPYKSEGFQSHFDKFNFDQFEYRNALGCNNEEKSHRWIVYLYMKNGSVFEMQQFFFQKQQQRVKYSFVYLVQGKGMSPKADLLTSYRVMRKKLKQQMKTSTDEQRVILDSQQLSIKLVCNSEYGQNGSLFSSNYNMFEDSLVTKCARYIIMNASDILQSRTIFLPKDVDKTHMNAFNTFVRQVYKNPEKMTLEMEDHRDEEKEIIDQLHNMGLSDEEIEHQLALLVQDTF